MNSTWLGELQLRRYTACIGSAWAMIVLTPGNDCTLSGRSLGDPFWHNQNLRCFLHICSPVQTWTSNIKHVFFCLPALEVQTTTWTTPNLEVPSWHLCTWTPNLKYSLLSIPSWNLLFSLTLSTVFYECMDLKSSQTFWISTELQALPGHKHQTKFQIEPSFCTTFRTVLNIDTSIVT